MPARIYDMYESDTCESSRLQNSRRVVYDAAQWSLDGLVGRIKKRTIMLSASGGRYMYGSLERDSERCFLSPEKRLAMLAKSRVTRIRS